MRSKVHNNLLYFSQRSTTDKLRSKDLSLGGAMERISNINKATMKGIKITNPLYELKAAERKVER
jgi:hypothetical protein